VQQLQQLNIPMKTFTAKNNSFDGRKVLIREMGAYFHKERALTAEKIQAVFGVAPTFIHGDDSRIHLIFS
jgi:hypothetical protein